VNGSLAAGSAVTVQTNAIFGGTGMIGGTVTNQAGGTLAPGGPVIGTLTTSNETWNAGGALVFKVGDATNTVMRDGIIIRGKLTLLATTNNPFTIDLVSMANSNTPGFIQDFNPTNSYSWTIVTNTGGTTGFSASAFKINTNGFSNPLEGAFGVTNVGNTLVVKYLPSSQPAVVTAPSVPSISNYAMLGGAFRLGFNGSAGQPYRVLGTNNLSAPLSTWVVLASGTIGTNGTVIFTDPSAATNKEWFYQIVSP
jgi:hypothetical protein